MDIIEQHTSNAVPQRGSQVGPGSIEDTLPNKKTSVEAEDEHPDAQTLDTKEDALRRGSTQVSLSDEDRFLEFIVKLHLLPTIIQLLCSVDLPALENARLQASKVLQYVRSKKPDDTILQARCCYYLGVADYVLSLHLSNLEATLKRRNSTMWFKRALEAEKRYPEGVWADQWIEFCNREEMRANNAKSNAGSLAAESMRAFQRLRGWLGLNPESRSSTQDSKQDDSREFPQRIPSFSTWPSSLGDGNASTFSRSGTLESIPENRVTEVSSETAWENTSLQSNKETTESVQNSLPETLITSSKKRTRGPPFFSSLERTQADPNLHNGETALSPTTYVPSGKWTRTRATYPQCGKYIPAVDKRRATVASISEIKADEMKPFYRPRLLHRRKSSWSQTLGLTKQHREDELGMAEEGASPRLIVFPEPQTSVRLAERQRTSSRSIDGPPIEGSE